MTISVGDGVSIGTMGMVTSSAGDDTPPTPSPKGLFTQSALTVTVTFKTTGEVGASRYLEHRLRTEPSGGTWTQSSAAADLAIGTTLTTGSLTAGAVYEFRVVDIDTSSNSTREGSITILTITTATSGIDACFKEQLDEDMATVFMDLCVFGENLTYTTSAGSTKVVKGVVNEQVGALDHVQRAQIYLDSDATAGIAIPVRAETITQGTTVWTIVDIRSSQGGHRCLCFLPLERN